MTDRNSAEESFYLLHERKRRRARYSLAFGISFGMAATIGFVTYFIRQDLLSKGVLALRNAETFPLAASIIGLVTGLIGFIYLQFGQRRSAQAAPLDFIQSLRAEIHRWRYEVRQLEEKVSTLSQPTVLSQTDLQQIKESVTKHITADTVSAIFQAQVASIEKEWKQNTASQSAEALSEPIVQRLLSETYTLRKRANLSLTIELGITGIGVSILFTGIQSVEEAQALLALAPSGDRYSSIVNGLIIPMAPRLGLVLLIEIFAYFFLRLYKENLAESKYFQNELTNVQLKMAAIHVAGSSGLERSLGDALLSLSSTERNFILRKDQTTVDLERERAQADVNKQLLKGFSINRVKRR